ncbi:hypothetical protein A3D77_02675 [Candidatus Gottesmanbacteria bacterium RIFCSPHIGHO2_02_FULL_39_11]|uniref:Methenyltetrahydrofolate cyclohydrolase n=1 Tax=Candidatus Gottesmanbacteria bacterium RIFCSPHIGHO2_02_FULL_39_11 TaxID=1798382 RepID=A0A1F5ZU34_9BACT|nr:MAG: hypothetical protein A3D77_02675 [Candidatus Gottesmanbacteria bacterium RIFCSPHIGHO2_02_FULL_39_11]
MVIPGNTIANSIKEKLKKKVSALPIPPHLAVVIVGNDPSSLKYISRKKKVGEEIGIKVTVFHLSSLEKLLRLLKSLNEDKTVHGIIIQRPVPLPIRKEELDLLVKPEKDVDGFHPQSKFMPPISEAILEILKWVYNQENRNPVIRDSSIEKRQTKNEEQFFHNWLSQKKVLIIGRGETGGIPIAKMLTAMGINPIIAHSKTENIKKLCLTSDIIISCVGKENIVRHDMVSKKTVLIGVGMHPEETPPASLTFSPDYTIGEIKDRVAYYTPVPGGVGPVNVACLLKNVVETVK